MAAMDVVARTSTSKRRRARLPAWYQRVVGSLRQFFADNALTDAVLCCAGGRQVRAHAPLLFLGSNLVRRLGRDAFTDGEMLICLPDFDAETVVEFLRTTFYGGFAESPGVNAEVDKLCRLFELRMDPEDVEDDDEDLDWEDEEEEEEEVQSQNEVKDDDLRILQTAQGELLLVNCGELDGESAEGMTNDNILGGVNFCPSCGKAPDEHLVSIDGGGSSLFHCCSGTCGQKPSLFRTWESLQNHLLDHVPSNGDKALCPLCQSDKESHRNKNEIGHKRGRLYKCCQCSASKLSSKQFSSHIDGHFVRGHRCRLCDREYRHEFQLERHMAREHGQATIAHMHRCTEVGCDYEVRHPRSLAMHRREKHSGEGKRSHRRKGDSQTETVQCPNCGKSLKKWYYSQFHKKMCNSETARLKCEICLQDGFVSKITLRNHIRSKHSNERPYQCEHCPARYATAMSLSGHRARKHNTNKAGDFVPTKIFVCQTCGKMLTTRTKLAQHIRTVHDQVRDFACDFCHKRFTSRSNLSIHVGTQHTGRLPYNCSFCGKGFARKDAMTRHMSFEHGNVADGPAVVPGDASALDVAAVAAQLQEEAGELSAAASEGIGVTDVVLQ